MLKLFEKITKNCNICKMKNYKFNKHFTELKVIIFKKPKIRYIGDLTDIPIEIIDKNKNYNYIYTIKDNFSKFADSYLMENKNSNNILNIVIVKNLAQIMGGNSLIIYC